MYLGQELISNNEVFLNMFGSDQYLKVSEHSMNHLIVDDTMEDFNKESQELKREALEVKERHLIREEKFIRKREAFLNKLLR